MDPALLAESLQDESDIRDGQLPWGYHEPAPDGFGHRDPSVVESDLEIELHYRDSLESGNERPWFTCGYCADRLQSASLGNALRWWKAHDCLTLEDRERLGRAYDLGISLPAGHPFAPSVDGKQAA